MPSTNIMRRKSGLEWAVLDNVSCFEKNKETGNTKVEERFVTF